MKPSEKGSRLILCVLLVSLSVNCIAQALDADQPRGALCFVWYNVENLFDPEDDPAEGDEEFTPNGPRRWTRGRYRDKLTALAKVIIASGRGEAPELVGLCEVENARVLEDLCSHPILSPCEYSYFHRDSRDHRGMDVACLIRPGSLEVFQWECLEFPLPVSGTRDLMHISLNVAGDTLDLFLAHLLSKYGGAGATADLRREQASMLAGYMDSVITLRNRGWVMAMGDFNETYQGYSLEPLRNYRFRGDSLISLLPSNGRGTYKYRGNWSPIDQVLVLGSHPRSMVVNSLWLSPMLKEDPVYGGTKPRRCYEGYTYVGGISDHLPLVIDFSPGLFPGPAAQ